MPSELKREGAIPVRWLYPISVALPLIVLNCGWIANSEMKTGVTEVTISSLFMGVTFILFVVTLLNLLVRKFAGAGAAMNQPEMMVLYTMLSISSVVAGMGHYGFFPPFLGNLFYYDRPSNGWHSFWHLLPWFVGPRDPDILKGFYEGHSNFFQPRILAAWTPPLLVWSVFFLILLWTTMCMGAIVRRRWTEDEHLPFPIIALPLEMTREGAPLYHNKLLWVGFAIPFLLHSLNSLASIFPTLPSLPINTVKEFATNLQYPFTGVGSISYALHPVGIGMGYLVSTDVSFSMWFFYLLRKAADVWGVTENWRDASAGWFADSNGQFPYINSQGWGSWLALGAATLWVGRGYFKAYFGRALRGDREGVDQGEPMSARMAVLGLIVGFLMLCAFVWSQGGSWWLPVLFLTLYILLMTALSRIRAEVAVLCSELVWVNPQSMITTVLGAGNLSKVDLAHTSMLSWFNTDYRAAPMPHELEGFVGLKRSGGALRPLVPVILLAAAVAMVSALVWDMQMYYVNGAATGSVNAFHVSKGSEPWNNLQGWLQNPKPPDTAAMGGMAFGIATTLLLSLLRARFVGFPLHPAAYAFNMTFANDFFWCDMFIAWLVKVCLLRYGGMKMYQTLLPLFLGLILGDFVTGSVWSIIGTVLHLNLFRTFAT
ncbi:hypothetical protein CCAX7_26730 [Capsulimonas corticalis]|uniref:Uncharacterized protein n=1 Tax=Capsulimonas corticalis TaxID=2219043 RepID=A0A9N7L393_9BACT|nr:DUF6785 family protein [Capsulimonas corticalis]BDI30622.1 hypothetical protein CCAX7_26730 [Capsulimonas corticalis]